jgi:tetratricopeptide (TPR) repeat protein
MDDRAAIAVLVSDLHWQIDQLGPRGIKDRAGNPYTPSYYKRGLRNAIDSGGIAVAEYVRGYLYKDASDGFRKLEEADSLDLASEALVIDESKPYASLFSEEDRAVARARLAPYIDAIERRKAERVARIEARRSELPTDLAGLRERAAVATEPEDVIAVNTEILERAPEDGVALNRLGRAYETIGSPDLAEETFRRAVEADPRNAIAARRLRDLKRRQTR